MARRSVPGGPRDDLQSIADLLGGALCVIECVAASLDARDQAGPEGPALLFALRGLNAAHARLVEFEPRNR